MKYRVGQKLNVIVESVDENGKPKVKVVNESVSKSDVIRAWKAYDFLSELLDRYVGVDNEEVNAAFDTIYEYLEDMDVFTTGPDERHHR